MQLPLIASTVALLSVVTQAAVNCGEQQCDVILSADSQNYFRLHKHEMSASANMSGKKICMRGGNYRALSIQDIQGRPGEPVTIINCDGQVVLDALLDGVRWNPLSVKNSTYIHLSGNGDSNHMYGIVAANAGSHGVHFDEGCSDVEVDHIETHSNGYAGIVVRTYPRCGGLYWRGTFTQYNTNLHHNYVHNCPGEAFYVGTSHYHKDELGYVYGTCLNGTETASEPDLVGVEIKHNLVEDIGRDGIQLGAAVENASVCHNTIRRFAYKHDYGHSFGIMLGSGTAADVCNNWIEGVKDGKGGDGDMAIGFGGHALDNKLSRIYNNVIVHVVAPFMFLNREDGEGQRYEFVYNTVYNFTSSAPLKVYCLPTLAGQTYIHAPEIIAHSNIFSHGSSELFEQYGRKKFYGNHDPYQTPEQNCLDWNHTLQNNLWALDDITIAGFQDVDMEDFHIASNSPAVGAGLGLTGVSILDDYDGAERSDPPDQGAYEHTGTDFNYDIIFKQDMTSVGFSETATEEELLFFYRISDKEAQVTLFQADCSTPPEGAGLALKPLVRVDGTLASTVDATVKIDVRQAFISSDTSVWSLDTAGSEGRIEFCIRMELLTDDGNISVNFHDTAVTVVVDMTQGFAMNSISTDRMDVNNFIDNTELAYSLLQYKCNENGFPDSSAVSQGDSLYLCIEFDPNSGGATDMMFDKIISLSLRQTLGEAKSTPVTDGVPDLVTTTNCSGTANNRKKCIIRTIMVSKFFTKDTENSPVVAEGTVRMQFGRRRLLRKIKWEQKQIERYLPNEKDSDDFRVTIEIVGGATGNTLEGDKSDDLSSNLQTSYGFSVIAGLAIGLAVLFVALFKVTHAMLDRVEKGKAQECDSR